jgi:hypothetical protein
MKLGCGLGLQYPRGLISGGGNVNWTPSDITTTLWLDSSDSSTITESGGAVSTWSDKSGGGYDASQTIGSDQPLTGIELINGLNTIKFDGINDTLRTSTNPFGASISDAFVIAVTKLKGFTQSGLFELSSPSLWRPHAPWDDGKVYFDVNNTVAGRVVTPNAIIADEEIWMAGFYCSVTESIQTIYKNGNVSASNNTGHSISVSGNVSIGSSAQFRQEGLIGEFIAIKGTVSVEERQKIEGYLAWKWGLQESLPIGHPYKNNAPTI